MQAIIFDRYGPPDVLRLVDQPTPVPGPGEVVVKIHASVATPPDCAFRSADPFIIRLMYGLRRPRNTALGSVLAGEISAVGDGVDRFAVGDRVMGTSDALFGTYAEYKKLGADQCIVPIPDTVGFAEAAALSEGYLTALPFLRDEANLSPGQTILINGASGSVGAIAVQLAKRVGAHVTGVSSARNLDLVRSLGADEVIDYGQTDFTRERGVYDVIFDAVGKSNFSRAKRALKARGVYMTTVPSWGIIIPTLRAKRAKGKRGLLATTGLRKNADKIKDLEELAVLMAQGAFTTVIDRAYPLAETAAAHAYVETERKRGSVIIAVTEAGRPTQTLEAGSVPMVA